MTKPSQLLTYLIDTAGARRMCADELADVMDLPRSVTALWFKGWDAPTVQQLPALAKALGADPIDLALGWVIDQAPELEASIYDQVLAPRGTAFPHSSDLALRGPAKRPAVERHDVGDPHDVARRSRDPAAPDPKVRKRARRR